MTPTDLLALISRLEGLFPSVDPTKLMVVDPVHLKTLCAELRVRIEREAVLLEALVAADDQLSRWPYTSEVIKGLYHPNTLIQKIRSALAEQKDTTP